MNTCNGCGDQFPDDQMTLDDLEGAVCLDCHSQLQYDREQDAEDQKETPLEEDR